MQNFMKSIRFFESRIFKLDKKSLSNTVGYTGDNLRIGSATILKANPLTRAGDTDDRKLIFWLLVVPMITVLILAVLVNR